MALEGQFQHLLEEPIASEIELSRELYNSLPTDDSITDITEGIVNQLAEIFVRNNAHKVFGIHLPHRHFRIPEKRVLYGDLSVSGSRWTHHILTSSLENQGELRCRSLILTDNGFRAYEYDGGKYPDFSKIKDGFLLELARFINANGLRGIIALEVLDDPLPQAMTEIVIGDVGTLMVKPERVKSYQSFRRTGYVFAEVDGKPGVSSYGAEEHAGTNVGHLPTQPKPKKGLASHQDALNYLKFEREILVW